MTLDLVNFSNACNPNGSLIGENKEEQYYIDLSSVRGRKLIEEFKNAIALSDKPTCQLLTAHTGTWKSQELQRLKTELDEEGWHVVYCKASQDLDLADVEILDVLLMLTRQVTASIEPLEIQLKSKYFSILFQEINLILQFPVEIFPQGMLSIELGKLTASMKDNPQLRFQLRLYLESRTEELLKAINEELLETANEELKRRGKKGLVVIVDELDNVTYRRLPLGQLQPEYLFIDQGALLRRLNCHGIYTIPLALMFSNQYEALKKRLGGGIAPKVLPMVPVRQRDGSNCKEGMALLRQVVLVRAFPDVKPKQRLSLITEIFDTPETLDRLCLISGGYVRHLLGLLYKCFWEEELPFSRVTLEKIIQEYRNGLLPAVEEYEWDWLRQVQQSKQVNTAQQYRSLIRSMFAYEYHDNLGAWFDVNPVLIETPHFKSLAAAKPVPS